MVFCGTARCLGDVAGRKSIRFVFHQQPEDAHPRGLGESGERENGLL